MGELTVSENERSYMTKRTNCGVYQSVIFGSLTLRNTNYVILREILIFQKFELSLSCSTFSRKVKKKEIQDQNNRLTIAGKYLKKQLEIAIRFLRHHDCGVEPT